MELDDDVQRLGTGIVRAEGADAKADLGSVLEVVKELLRAVKIETVGEQQQLCPGINAVALVVLDDLLAPFIRIARIVPHTVVVVDHGAVEVHQKQVGGDGIGQGGTVVAVVFVIPVAHCVVVGVGEGVAVDALIHLHELMRIGADGGQVVFHREVHVRGADTFVCLGGQSAHHDVLPFTRESSAAAEFGKLEGIGAVV